jgi:hypothetical protein
MATPSITMIPSGYKSQKVYSVLPTNGDGDLTFDRNNIGTRVNKNGLIEQVSTDVPRLDYSDGSCPSLLLEPSSTNLVIGSAEGNYGGGQSSATNTISPDGTNNAFIPTPDYVYRRYEEIIPAGTYSNGQKLTYSWYRKRISTPTGVSRTGDLNIKSLVNLTELETSNATQIESNINGFDRFQAVVEIIDGSLESIFRAYFGDVVEVGNSSVAYFGHQFEALPYATSYIPTTTGSASRGVDSASKDGLSSYISSTEGVLYAELKALSSESTNQRWIYIGDGSIDNFVAIVYMPTSNELVAYGLNGGNSSLYISTTNYNLTDDLKVAIKWKENDSQLYINGSLIDTDTDTQDFNFTFSELRLEGSAANKFYGKVKDLRVYNTALTDLELQELTTI